MKISYDREADAMYIELQGGDFVENKEVMEGFVLDIGDGGKLLGIELLDVSTRIPREELGRFTINIPLEVEKPVI